MMSRSCQSWKSQGREQPQPSKQDKTRDVFMASQRSINWFDVPDTTYSYVLRLVAVED